ncbi:alpha/beta fold hydrolase [Guyparkeria sp. TX1]|uniref:alpha/beta fold hydrolase n=1 Tax=Guyparkeria sp. TX1 TaxID=3115001 RepID=UPI003977A0CB
MMLDDLSARPASVGLVAGWSFPATVFDPLVRQLPGDEVVAFDWSTFSSDWLGRGQEERAVPGLGPAVWVGWSLGGSLLLEAVRRGRIRPARLVLIQATPRFLAEDGWPGVSLGDWQGLRRAAGRQPVAAAAAFRRRFDLPNEPAPSAQLAATEGLDWLARLDLRSQLVSIEVPVDIWLAPDDPLVPVDWPKHLELPAHVHVHRFEQGGHAEWLDHAASLARSLVRPLADDPGARSAR